MNCEECNGSGACDPCDGYGVYPDSYSGRGRRPGLRDLRRVRVLPGLPRHRNTARHGSTGLGNAGHRTRIGCERGMTTTISTTSTRAAADGQDRREQGAAAVGRGGPAGAPAGAGAPRLDPPPRPRRRWPPRSPGGPGSPRGCGWRRPRSGGGSDMATTPDQPPPHRWDVSGAAGEPAGAVPVRRVLGRPAGRRRRPRRSRAAHRRRRADNGSRGPIQRHWTIATPDEIRSGLKRCRGSLRILSGVGEAVRTGTDRAGLEALTRP